MKVIALELGYDNVQLRAPGEVFDLSDELVLRAGPAWFEPVDEADKAKVAKLNKDAKKSASAVAAVDAAKQAAAFDESVKKAAELQKQIDALTAENDALKKK